MSNFILGVFELPCRGPPNYSESFQFKALCNLFFPCTSDLPNGLLATNVTNTNCCTQYTVFQLHPVRSMYCTCDFPWACLLIWHTINIRTRSSRRFYYILPLNCKNSENPGLKFVPLDANLVFTPQRKIVKLLIAKLIFNICKYQIWCHSYKSKD